MLPLSRYAEEIFQHITLLQNNLADLQFSFSIYLVVELLVLLLVVIVVVVNYLLDGVLIKIIIIIILFKLGCTGRK